MPRQELIERYGLQRFYEVVDEREVDVVTLPCALAEAGVGRIDYLKTDVEGLDTGILRSRGALLDSASVVCCEFRFEPFYVGEATYCEGAAVLDGHGFELIALRPQDSKPMTRRSAQHRDGRTVWADCIFVRRADALPGGQAEGLVEAKQIVLTAMAGHRAWAEHLLERFLDRIPAEWHPELWDITAPPEVV